MCSLPGHTSYPPWRQRNRGWYTPCHLEALAGLDLRDAMPNKTGDQCFRRLSDQGGPSLSFGYAVPNGCPLSANPRAVQSIFADRPGGYLELAVQQTCLLPRTLPLGSAGVGSTAGHAGGMPDRSFPAVDHLARRAQRIAAGRPDPIRILAKTITMTGVIGMDPYAVLGAPIEMRFRPRFSRLRQNDRQRRR